MNVGFRALFATLLLSIPFFAAASTPKVVATIKPIGLIAKDIVGGAGSVDVLLPPAGSPHDYALKPSDIKKLHQADLVVWVGPEMEIFLQKLLNDHDNTLQLTAVEGMPLRYYSGDEEHHDHEEHNHSHDGIDAHIWLGPEQSKVIAKAISTALSKVSPENAATYEANYEKFVQQVNGVEKQLAAALDTKNAPGYFLFHDAYAYFEQAFGLKPTGHFTVNPDRKPGARTLIEIRSALEEKKAKCVFTEPQFNPAIVESVVKHTHTKTVELDPMAQDINFKTQGYKDFLLDLGSRYETCFE
ncbi:zinc ABC transporter substrate-binding protein ZnuA [Enterovibrio nigricans]|uniref:High-affinity zinc uptake system protein ZnuA n=1 Tax=Enterovibrio nigricans DSM 22720 TaxID=1121868 RepID=A0A1T4V2P4_9GAMM|nr:zinc ABC transporter substrate-binding protein ZnuA [Enterovibrio nigricans]PKF50504.1 zinc ABC transporter substrate-binding protein [Enterovibrio nigricans]SKA59225.1 zinc transport system substrate-binding protein [Enterovibrio nigricans DSM 22720]